jgi:hypothetical protein
LPAGPAGTSCAARLGSRLTPPAQFSSRKDEQTLLRSTRIHGVKAADRGFLAATIDTDPAGAKAQSY